MFPKHKVCRVCRQDKPLREFTLNGKMKDLRENTCKQCLSDRRKKQKEEK